MTIAVVVVALLVLTAAAIYLAQARRQASSYARRIRQHEVHTGTGSVRGKSVTSERPRSREWDPFRARPRRSDAGDAAYHARVGAGEHAWDPYAEEQSRARRVRNARRKPGAARLPDYYALLEIDPGATDPQIERAYRRLVAQYHPDRFFEDPEGRRRAEARLKEINAAMRVLRDPVRRAQYDAER